MRANPSPIGAHPGRVQSPSAWPRTNNDPFSAPIPLVARAHGIGWPAALLIGARAGGKGKESGSGRGEKGRGTHATPIDNADWSTLGRMSKMTKGKSSKETNKLPTKKASKSVTKGINKVTVKGKGEDTIPKDGTSMLRTRKKSSSAEIDELFDAAERRKTATITATATSTATFSPDPSASSHPPSKARPNHTDDGFSDTRGAHNKARPLTADGLPIFTAEEMKIGQGGDTPDCPFDCACCH